jgi:hypothetical protein
MHGSCLWWSFLDYFSMVVRTCTHDPRPQAYFDIGINTHPWDPDLWLYNFTVSIEGNTFLMRVGYWDPPQGCNNGVEGPTIIVTI